MPDALHIAQQPVSVTQCDGWLVRLTKRRRFGRGWMYDLQYYEDWHEAQANYERPGGDWQGDAIFGCVEGEPGPKLSAHTIAQICREAGNG